MDEFTVISVRTTVLEALKAIDVGEREWDDLILKALAMLVHRIDHEPPRLGGGRIELVEFSDFECYYCKEMVPVVKQILGEFNGEVELVFRHYPRTLKHPNAVLAHAASVLMQNLGKFWDYHDRIFERLEKLGKEAVYEVAKELGVEKGRLRGYLGSNEPYLAILKDKLEGMRMGVRRVPTLFINGTKV
jgi:protein-disulfide isomerase